jgi:hypothetical protein
MDEREITEGVTVPAGVRRTLQSSAWATSLTAVDLLVVGLLVGLGALQWSLSVRSDAFFAGDVTYYNLAQALLETGQYGVNGKLESMFPPGFPGLLALQCLLGGCRRLLMVRAIVVCTTVGLLASYALLRRLQGRWVAAVTCLLLGSSLVIFALVTRTVLSDLPYFCTSLLTLVVAIRLETVQTRRTRVVLELLCGGLVVVSLLLRSVAVALLGGLAAWLVMSCCIDWHTATRRLKIFLPILLLGLVVQGWWMHWAKPNEAPEWPLLGWPVSYSSQLWLKDGHYPELGAAVLSDLPARVGRNLIDRTLGLMDILMHHTRRINRVWFSPVVFGPIVLVLVGLGCSLWPTGGQWPEWYFICYEAMYLLWPWDLETRFLLPVAPLACLYLWRGGVALLRGALQKPRVVGILSFPMVVVLGVVASVSGGG